MDDEILNSSNSDDEKTNKYLFNFSDYIFKAHPYRGCLGFVHFYNDKSTNKEYAIKCSHFEYKSQDKQFIFREMSNLINLYHPTLLHIEGFSYEDWFEKNKIGVLMKYMNKGSLANLIYRSRSYEFNEFDNTKLQIILIGISRGMMLLHQQNIIHGNLKPENIFFDNQYRPLISEYGLSKLFNPENLPIESQSINYLAYLAPEVINGNHYSEKSDVYAFGIIMLEIISKKGAFNTYFSSKSNESKFKQKILDQSLRPSVNIPIKKGLKRMIEYCLSYDPKERPTFQELFNKLSMSEEDDFIDHEVNHYKPVIKSDEGYSPMDYCLDDVNEEELFLYIEEILDEITPENKEVQELKVLKEKIDELNETVVNKLTNDNSQMNDTIKDLKREIAELQDGDLHQSDDINTESESESNNQPNELNVIQKLIEDSDTSDGNEGSEELNVIQKLIEDSDTSDGNEGSEQKENDENDESSSKEDERSQGTNDNSESDNEKDETSNQEDKSESNDETDSKDNETEGNSDLDEESSHTDDQEGNSESNEEDEKSSGSKESDEQDEENDSN